MRAARRSITAVMIIVICAFALTAYAQEHLDCLLEGRRCPIPNNDAANATQIRSIPYFNRQGTAGATMEATEKQPSSVPQPTQPTCPNSTIGATVWYKYVAPSAQSLVADTLSSQFDTILAIWSDPTGAGSELTLQGCSDNYLSKQSRIQFVTMAGTTYWFQVGGAGGAAGALNFKVVNNPGHDSMADAIPLMTIPSVISGTNVGATLEANELRPCGNLGASVWYKLIVAGASGTVTFETSGSSFDTALAVYRWDNGVGIPNLVGCNDDVASGATWSSLTSPVFTGGVYYIQVAGANGDYGAYKLVITSTIPQMPTTNVSALDAPYVKSSYNPDGSVTLWVDSNGNGQPDGNEPQGTLPGLPGTGPIALDPRSQVNSDGSVTLYNDTNHNRTKDPDETGVTTPAILNISVKLNPDNSVTVYNDLNDNGNPDAGEVILTTPAPPPITPPVVAPKLKFNPDGSITVYNDRDGDNTVDPGEEIATVPAATVPGPTNDNRASAADIGGQVFADVRLTSSATVESGEPTGCGTMAATVWYRWAGKGGSVIVDSQPSSYPVAIAVYSVASDGTLTLVACSSQGMLGNSTVGFQASASTTYLFQVGSRSSSGGLLKLAVAGL